MHASRGIALFASTLFIAACQPVPTPEAVAAPRDAHPAPAAAVPEDTIARGEYLVRIAGCNDCHTAGYAEAGGEVDTARWLTGSPLGYRGPWGTTYATNLRLRIDGMEEAEWLAYTASLRTRPIMPDFVLRTMHEADRVAIYRFVKSLGPAGEPAPAFVPPGGDAPRPYFELVLPDGPPPAAAGAP